MELKKVKDTYNVYTAKMSFGELEALRASLAKDHAGAIADELHNTFSWFFRDNHLPFPGQEEEEIKAQKEKEKEADKKEEEGGEEMSVGLDLPPEGDEPMDQEPSGPGSLDPAEGGPEVSPAEEEVPLPEPPLE